MDPLLAPIPGADHREVGGCSIDVARVANGRVKRVVYPPGFRWSTHMKPVTKTDRCMHAHVGYLVQGQIKGTYADGCGYDFRAPAAVCIEPGHDGWVEGGQAAVLIEFDWEGETVRRCGLPAEHRHA